MERKAALDRLLPIQRADFVELFTAMAPNPVTVRLLDPPMHEFLPTEQHLLEQIETLRAIARLCAAGTGASDARSCHRQLPDAL